jgi:hypothetical protein
MTMSISRHADQRMNQRGIPRRLVDFTLRQARRVIADLQEQLRLALQVMDKGGVAVVEAEGTIVTTYNVDPACRRPRHLHPGMLHG